MNICTLQVEKVVMLTCGNRSYDTLRTDQRCPKFIVVNMSLFEGPQMQTGDCPWFTQVMQ